MGCLPLKSYLIFICSDKNKVKWSKSKTCIDWNLSLDEICGYTVYKWRSDLPFKVVLLDRRTGDAKIVLAEGARLDYEEKHKYSFDVAAYDCQTGTHAPRLTLFRYMYPKFTSHNQQRHRGSSSSSSSSSSRSSTICMPMNTCKILKI